MIKFRVWFEESVLKKAHMVDWEELKEFKGLSRLFDDAPHSETFSLMQSTGLKDKNGVEIFEGDVLRVYEIDDTAGESEYTSPVIWKDYGWLVYDTDTDIPLFLLDRDSDFGDRDVEIEVLGNIHANPELLNSGIE